MSMLMPKRQIERLILALCDELKWGLRCLYAAKILHQRELRLTPTLYDTFYCSCLDNCALILSRIIVSKKKYKDDSVNLQYLLDKAKNNPLLFCFAKPDEIKELVISHVDLMESYKSLIDTLEDQRDRNLTHLDLKHIKQPEWRENQAQLDMIRVEKLYQDLTVIMKKYYLLFFDEEIDFGAWEKISHAEVEILIEYYEAYQSKS